MKINIKRLNSATHLQATNDTGNTLDMDGSPQIGGENKGFRPMQAVLASLAGCSSRDIISILQKQKEGIRDYEVEITGTRAEDKIPAVFTDIHILFKVFGTVNEEKLQRAIELSMTKYCSVTKMLEPTVNITHSYTLEP